MGFNSVRGKNGTRRTLTYRVGKITMGSSGSEYIRFFMTNAPRFFLVAKHFFTLIRQNRDTGYFPMKKVKCDRIYLIFRILITFFLLSS